MVRGMVGTMLKVGRGLITIERLKQIIEAKDNTKADFTTPPHGLFLVEVLYPDGILI
jgi:tRNA pseudouridine38-40 synthase